VSCPKREKTGSCGHYRCQYTTETDHGFECVDVVFDAERGYCEVGLGCVERCGYSFSPAVEPTARAVFDTREERHAAEWLLPRRPA
jgi:hypothetical protein